MAASRRVFPPPKVRINMDSLFFFGAKLCLKPIILLIDLGVSFFLSLGPAQLSLGHSAFFMRRYAYLAGTVN